MAWQTKHLDAIRLGADDLEQLVQDGLSEYGDEDYIDNLSDLCEIGGCPDEDKDPEFTVTGARLEGNIVTFSCEVYFDEKVYGGGCPDMPTIKSRHGTKEYVLNLNNGTLVATPSKRDESSKFDPWVD